jgi:hypothetical protein
MISASGFELAQRCPGSLTVPHVQEDNEHSLRGTADHAADEDAINAGDVPDAYLERWPEVETWRAEVSYAYDVSSDTSRFLGTGLKRAYGNLAPFETPGTIDVEGRGPGVLVVIDKKGYEAVTPAARNPQVRFLALAAARVATADRIEVAIAPKIGGLDVAEVDPVFDLDVIAHETRQRLLEITRVRTDARDGKPIAFNIGRWCRWCNAFSNCPKQDELKSLAKLDDDHPEIDLLRYQDAADVFDLWKRVGILHKRLGQQIYAQAAREPIKLRSGKVFGKVISEGNRVYDGAKVHAAISAHPELGREVADMAVVMSVSQTRFDEVVKPLVKRGQFAKIQKAVFDAVEADGGMTRKTKESFEEYDQLDSGKDDLPF